MNMSKYGIGFIVTAVFFLVVFAYGVYEGSAIIAGPKITLDSSEATVTQNDPLFTLSGTATRITTLLLNGRILPITEDGHFSDELLLAPGYNEISIVARDRTDREQTKTLRVVYHAPSTSPYTVPDQSLPINAL